MDLASFLEDQRVLKEIKDIVKHGLPMLDPEDYAILRVLAAWDEASQGNRRLSNMVDPVFMLGLRNEKGEYAWWRLERLRTLELAADMGARSPINQARITEAGRVAYKYLVSEGAYEPPTRHTPSPEATEG